ncbi:hypothetical protein [Thiocapsa marina]|uniref:Uncharacterized protein n=1 Tax=Thiocapsa marina 5811 TaxID=768671 RepID=F9U5W9_9GAMM|nr:hypothetical protein [Thiocapsa marina]EGV20542.1 hypothetical protein ThimaDRAFT_0320 [Thiocapsa marina 5811]
MSVGGNTLDWLRTELFQVEDAWSEETARGFRWWPHRQAQTLEVIGRDTGPGGASADLVLVRTELLRELHLDEEVLQVLQAVALRTAGMAGPVYDPARRTLDLCTLVRVYADIDGWMRRLIGLAAMLQIRDADRGASAIAEAVGAVSAQSAHPEQGARAQPSALIAEALLRLDAEGRAPSRWPGEELEGFAETYLDQSPAMTGSGDATGFTAEFPHGKRGSSRCELATDQTHPWYGHGLALRQRFPVSVSSDAEGRRLALELNARALSETPMGYGFGSFGYQDEVLAFQAFFPNPAYRSGLVTNLYLSCAERARMLSVLLTGVDWTEESFEPGRSGTRG